MMRLIASGNKSILEKAYAIELQDLNLIVKITLYLKQKLDEKFPNQNNEAKINPHLKNASQHSQRI